MININSYPQTIVDEKIKLLDRIRHELLSSLKTEPSQYVINRLDLIDRKLTQLRKKATGAGTPTTSEYCKYFNGLSIADLGGNLNE